MKAFTALGAGIASAVVIGGALGWASGSVGPAAIEPQAIERPQCWREPGENYEICAFPSPGRSAIVRVRAYEDGSAAVVVDDPDGGAR